MASRFKTIRPALRGAIAAALVSVAVVVSFAGTAFAQTVTLPAGNPTDGQTITVSGTGFPVHSALPSGLEIIECSDPGGLVGNLPTDASTGCDGTTVNGSQINTDASGNFSASYSISALSSSGNSDINCDATDFCVLWVGQDFNNSFLSGPHAFSRPFEVQAPTATTPEAPLAIALPVCAAGVVGAYLFLRRRRSGSTLTH